MSSSYSNVYVKQKEFKNCV